MAVNCVVPVLSQADLASAQILVAAVRQWLPCEYRLLVVAPRALFAEAVARLRLHGADSELIAVDELFLESPVGPLGGGVLIPTERDAGAEAAPKIPGVVRQNSVGPA